VIAFALTTARFGGWSGVKAFEIVPLLAVPVGIYNLAAVIRSPAGPDVFATEIEGKLFELTLPSDAIWIASPGDLIALFALGILFWELLRSTSSGRYALINHSLSLLLFLICFVQFLLLPAFATTTFLLITVMCFLDVLAGAIVSVVTARRDISVPDCD
jgi:hypothetical protein